MNLLKFNIAHCCFAALLIAGGCATTNAAPTPQKTPTSDKSADIAEESIVSYLSGAAFITQDIDASVDFYTQYLGFIERKRSVLDNEGTRAVFGLGPDETVIYSALVPVNFSKDRPDFTAVNFAQPMGKAKTAFAQDTRRGPLFGEPVLAFNVTQLKETERQMREAGIAIVDPLKTSPTGRSLTLTVLDPNGIRVQMYEMIE